VDPATAFEAFTRDIGVWYRPGPYSWNHPDKAVGIRFEPGVGGRLVEMHDPETGEGFEMGRILVWDPPDRLSFAFRSVFFPPDPGTEVEVRFEPIDDGTRVTLEHRGLDRLPPDFVRTQEDRAWVMFMAWFEEYAAELARDSDGVGGSPS